MVNATLLEVFLAFVFLVLTLAYFERSRADVADQARHMADLQLDSVVRENSRVSRERDSFQALYLSQFVPKCDNGAPKLRIRLAAPQQWVVFARASLGRWQEDSTLVTPGEFAEQFALTGQLTAGRMCRYVAEVLDEGALNKEQFKEALRIITGRFYQTGAYRRSPGP